MASEQRMNSIPDNSHDKSGSRGAITGLIWKLKKNPTKWGEIKTHTTHVTIENIQLHDPVNYTTELRKKKACSQYGSLVECLFAELLKPEFKKCPSSGVSLITREDIPEFIKWCHEPLNPEDKDSPYMCAKRHSMPFDFDDSDIEPTDIRNTLIPSLREAIRQLEIVDSDRSPNCGHGTADFLVYNTSKWIILDLKNVKELSYDDILQIVYYGCYHTADVVWIYNPQLGFVYKVNIGALDKSRLLSAMR